MYKYGSTLKNNIPLDVYILLGLFFQIQSSDFRITFHYLKIGRESGRLYFTKWSLYYLHSTCPMQGPLPQLHQETETNSPPLESGLSLEIHYNQQNAVEVTVDKCQDNIRKSQAAPA